MSNDNKRKTSVTQKLGIGKGGFKKAIRDGILLSIHDPDAYDCGVKHFDNRCAYCGMRGDVIQLTADHIVPSIKGGRFVKGNIVPACQKCNSLRREQDISEFVGDTDVIQRIVDFQRTYQFTDSGIGLDDELGVNGKMILDQLDSVLSVIRDVARNAIRANERDEEVPLEEWAKAVIELTKQYKLI